MYLYLRLPDNLSVPAQHHLVVDGWRLSQLRQYGRLLIKDSAGPIAHFHPLQGVILYPSRYLFHRLLIIALMWYTEPLVQEGNDTVEYCKEKEFGPIVHGNVGHPKSCIERRRPGEAEGRGHDELIDKIGEEPFVLIHGSPEKPEGLGQSQAAEDVLVIREDEFGGGLDGCRDCVVAERLLDIRLLIPRLGGKHHLLQDLKRHHNGRVPEN